MLIVTAGKGGVGKTTLTAALARLAQAQGREFAVVDADPVGMLSPLLQAPQPASVADLSQAGLETLTSDHVRDLLTALPQGGHLLRMGRPRSEGCFCRANALTRAALSLVLQRFRLVLMDNEAGLEHIARGNNCQAGRLVLAADSSLASFAVAKDILEAMRAPGKGKPPLEGTAHLVVRVNSDAELLDVLRRQAGEMELPQPWFLRNDPDIARVQMRGSPFPLLEDDVAFLNAAREWAEAQTILA